jgi:hypothetical protein
MDDPSEGSSEASSCQMLGNMFADCDDTSARIGAEVNLFLQQSVPSVIPFDPREGRTIDEHRSLGEIGKVISLHRTAKISSNAKVKDEIINREEKVSESRFYSRSCVVCRTSPPTQGRLHAYQNVLNWSEWFRIWHKDVTIGLRERLHSFLKLSVCGFEASVVVQCE